MNKDIMMQMGYNRELIAIDNGLCPFCNKPVKESDLKDALSTKEFNISGLCQKCQDGFFSTKPKKKFCTEYCEMYIAASRAKESLVDVCGQEG